MSSLGVKADRAVKLERRRGGRQRGPRPLAGQRVLITGGTSGIGFVTAQQLVLAGSQVAILARGREALSEVAQKLPSVATIAADVGNQQEARAAVEEAAERLGGLDAVVVCAGAASYGPFVESNLSDYEQTIRTTLMGTIHTAHAALPHLERTCGSLVVVGSVAGRLPTPWLATYAAAKHAVRGFVRSLACELRAQRRPVRVALIAPGPVDTPFWRRARTPDGRLPPEIRGAYPPEDVAAEIVASLRKRGPVERTVGGLFVPAIALDALIPNRILGPLGVIARLGWRAREQRPVSHDDVFAQPTSSVHASGGLTSRRSILTALRSHR